MKKGFTLIELLAVIVILAVIALIATPMILNVVEDAKKGAVLASANGYLEALENYQVMAEFKNEEKFTGTVQVSEINSKISVKGDMPKSGTVTITDGKIADYELQFESYIVSYDEATNKAVATKTDVTYNAYGLGDEVSLANGSEWYVLEDKGITSSDIVLISKYLVNITTNQQDSTLDGTENNGAVLYDDESRNNENNTYCQLYENASNYQGCNAYSAVDGLYIHKWNEYDEEQNKVFERVAEGTVTEDSLIKKYVDTYVASLNLGNNLLSSGLVTIQQLEEAGCIDDVFYTCKNISWLKGFNYWTQSPTGNGVTFLDVVYKDGSLGGRNNSIIYYENESIKLVSDFGLRPVITIKKEALN